jgi:hypothetical protein
MHLNRFIRSSDTAVHPDHAFNRLERSINMARSGVLSRTARFLATAAAILLPIHAPAATLDLPVNVPFLSYTGQFATVNIPAVQVAPLKYTGRMTDPLPAITTPQLAFSGKGDAKGIKSVAVPALTYAGKTKP